MNKEQVEKIVVGMAIKLEKICADDAHKYQSPKYDFHINRISYINLMLRKNKIVFGWEFANVENAFTKTTITPKTVLHNVYCTYASRRGSSISKLSKDEKNSKRLLDMVKPVMDNFKEIKDFLAGHETIHYGKGNIVVDVTKKEEEVYNG